MPRAVTPSKVAHEAQRKNKSWGIFCSTAACSGIATLGGVSLCSASGWASVSTFYIVVNILSCSLKAFIFYCEFQC